MILVGNLTPQFMAKVVHLQTNFCHGDHIKFLTFSTCNFNPAALIEEQFYPHPGRKIYPLSLVFIPNYESLRTKKKDVTRVLYVLPFTLASNTGLHPSIFEGCHIEVRGRDFREHNARSVSRLLPMFSKPI